MRDFFQDELSIIYKGSECHQDVRFWFSEATGTCSNYIWHACDIQNNFSSPILKGNLLKCGQNMPFWTYFALHSVYAPILTYLLKTVDNLDLLSMPIDFSYLLYFSLWRLMKFWYSRVSRWKTWRDMKKRWRLTRFVWIQTL